MAVYAAGSKSCICHGAMGGVARGRRVPKARRARPRGRAIGSRSTNAIGGREIVQYSCILYAQIRHFSKHWSNNCICRQTDAIGNLEEFIESKVSYLMNDLLRFSAEVKSNSCSSFSEHSTNDHFFRKFKLCEITRHVSLNRRVSFYFTSVPYKHTVAVPFKCAINDPT